MEAFDYDFSMESTMSELITSGGILSEMGH